MVTWRIPAPFSISHNFRYTTEYERAHETYQAQMNAYENAFDQYHRDQTAYQEAIRPYEEALESQKTETEKHETQREIYQKEYSSYAVELAQFNASRVEQDQLLADYEKAYEEYEQHQAVYDNAHAEHKRQLESYEQSQANYQTALADYQKAIEFINLKEPPAKLFNKRIILGSSAAVLIVMGIALLILIENVLLGTVPIFLGLGLALAAFLRKSPSEEKMLESTPANEINKAPSKPEQPDIKKPEPPTLERPIAPKRPKLEPLNQPKPPTLPEPVQPTSRIPKKPNIERPRQPTIEKPQVPDLKQPEPPDPLPPAPEKPTLDDQRLLSGKDELQKILDTAECNSIEELNSGFSKAMSFRNRKETAHSRLEGLLGNNTMDSFEEQRREASRKRRDAEEILEEPDLQMAATMSPLEVNRLKADIVELEKEREDLVGRQQRLRARLEVQNISSEDLLQAEEELEAASAAYERAKERNKVYQSTFDLLNEARSQTLVRAQEQLGPQTSGYFESLTRGRYKQVRIDPNLQVEIEDPTQSENFIRPDYLSRGTRDQLYMSARMALVNLLFPNTRPPILLDDPFVQFDPQRLESAIEMCLEMAEERQILLFTCSDNYNHVGNQILMKNA